MQIIGFTLTKISAEKMPVTKIGEVNTSIDFSSVHKEPVTLIKDTETLKIPFSYKATYFDQDKKDKSIGSVSLEGTVLITADKEESKELLKNWKKKEYGPVHKALIFNFIVKKCVPKAIYLEEELGLPFNIHIPKVQPKE